MDKPQLLALIKEIEWGSHELVDDGDDRMDEIDCCPYCRRDWRHAEGCKIAQALREG